MNCPQTEPPCDVQKIGSYCVSINLAYVSTRALPCCFTNNSLLKFPIQTGTPNWKCYTKTGYPGCCSKNNGQNCPSSYEDAQAKYPCSNEDVIVEDERE